MRAMAVQTDTTSGSMLLLWKPWSCETVSYVTSETLLYVWYVNVTDSPPGALKMPARFSRTWQTPQTSKCHLHYSFEQARIISLSIIKGTKISMLCQGLPGGFHYIITARGLWIQIQAETDVWIDVLVPEGFVSSQIYFFTHKYRISEIIELCVSHCQLAICSCCLTCDTMEDQCFEEDSFFSCGWSEPEKRNLHCFCLC